MMNGHQRVVMRPHQIGELLLIARRFGLLRRLADEWEAFEQHHHHLDGVDVVVRFREPQLEDELAQLNLGEAEVEALED